MSLTFYFAPMSTATITELVIEELGIPCEKVQLDLKAGDTKKPEFLKLNPNGKVPLLVHDGVAIWESSAITMYLGETFGVDDKALPRPRPEARRGDEVDRVDERDARRRRRSLRAQHDELGAGRAAQREGRRGGEEGHRDAASTSSIKPLDGRQFLTGEYTLADTHVNSFVDWLRHMQIDFAAFERVNAWSKRCTARPAYAKVMGGSAK